MRCVDVSHIVASKSEQHPALQTQELTAVGCEGVFEERIYSRAGSYPQLEAAINYYRRGDVLVIWTLDRLGRSIRELIDLVNGFKDRGVGFRSPRESLDTTIPGGKLVFRVFASIAVRAGRNPREGNGGPRGGSGPRQGGRAQAPH